ncbi:MAG: hypothetical protein JW804_00355 [Sedimentisphaerales bacterium]|nr:hypothetical protein [Sedimentisphaerales bacterium]
MSIMLFIIVLVASFIVVRIGAVAFQLTGLEWSLAKFQSLSCFSGTGFTTKEAELITGHPQRRRIASVLMVLGNAGLVTLIAAVASALNPQNTMLVWFSSKSLLPFSIPPWLVMWVNLSIIIIAIYVTYKVFTNTKLTHKLTNYLRKKIIRRQQFGKVSFEELTVATGGYGVTRIQVNQNSPVLDKTLIEAGLRKMDINILAIIRGETTIANPGADNKIGLSDELICFGKLGEIRDKLCPPLEKKEAEKGKADT